VGGGGGGWVGRGINLSGMQAVKGMDIVYDRRLRREKKGTKAWVPDAHTEADKMCREET